MRHLLATFLMLLSFTTQAEEALMLYGGDGHKQFLGCLNCSKYDGNALCNKYGQSGSKYSSESIWNKYGNFGSKYSNFSPWNKYSASAPIIVDKMAIHTDIFPLINIILTGQDIVLF